MQASNIPHPAISFNSVNGANLSLPSNFHVAPSSRVGPISIRPQGLSPVVSVQSWGTLRAWQWSACRHNYKSVVDALSQMSKQEGVMSLWQGSSVTVNWAMIVTASQLASYDQIKEMILEEGVMSDGIGTNVAASLEAGFVAAVASNPIDVIKTRVMNMKMEVGAAPLYKV
ncbi:hypothetical protein Pint_33412 [Pistacia integerrima]|uniref:Uncharacterized protein n=1 Tax=Pistacia integerrima TaxID=434235 RepID=A0ACC0X5T7_9ROSI|nr:hypothetical protein Pint_33412 [Pistacia integerrima]